MKEFLKSTNTFQRCVRISSGTFLWLTVWLEIEFLKQPNSLIKSWSTDQRSNWKKSFVLSELFNELWRILTNLILYKTTMAGRACALCHYVQSARVLNMINIFCPHDLSKIVHRWWWSDWEKDGGDNRLCLSSVHWQTLHSLRSPAQSDFEERFAVWPQGAHQQLPDHQSPRRDGIQETVIAIRLINPLECKGNYSAKPLMGELLHLERPQPVQAHPRCTVWYRLYQM